MKKFLAVSVLVLLASGCTTTEIKQIESRLATVEAEVQHLKGMAHPPAGVIK